MTQSNLLTHMVLGNALMKPILIKTYFCTFLQFSDSIGMPTDEGVSFAFKPFNEVSNRIRLYQ